MKTRSLLFVSLIVLSLVFSACNSSNSTPEPVSQQALAPPDPTATFTPVPTIEPTLLPTSTLESTSTPIPTLPPADMTITFDGKAKCEYDGSQPVPAAESLTVNWYITSTEYNYYVLLSAIVTEGHTAQDLMEEAKNTFPPPTWSEQVGDIVGQPASSVQGTIRTSSGSPDAPLFFICWAGGDAFSIKPVKIIGPIAVQ